MSNVIEIIKTVLPVILILFIGMLCRRFKILSAEGISALKSTVVNITLPAVVLGAFARMEYTLDNVLVTVLIYFLCIVALFLGKLIGVAFKGDKKFLPFITTGFEAGMIGYALFTMLYGADRISEFASVDLGQVLFVFTAYKVLLDLQENNKPSLKKIAVDMVSSPIIISIAVGIIIGATGLYSALIPSGVSGVFDTCVDFISAPTSAIILITIGYDLAPGEIPFKKTLGAVFSRVAVMLICRVLAEVIIKLLGIKLNISDALNILFILPPPFVLAVFANDKEEQAYISSSLSFSTVVAIIGFIILAVIG
ncbi:MAG: hypothetical protein IJP22_01500 [Clostridia bacterium]|nr:hypothetical protein [Clostridia bacterium]